MPCPIVDPYSADIDEALAIDRLDCEGNRGQERLRLALLRGLSQLPW